MTEEIREALAELAVLAAVNVERAPGPVERRLVLRRAFAEAHRLHPAVTDDPDLGLVDGLLRQRDTLVPHLVDLWIGEAV